MEFQQYALQPEVSSSCVLRSCRRGQTDAQADITTYRLNWPYSCFSLYHLAGHGNKIKRGGTSSGLFYFTIKQPFLLSQRFPLSNLALVKSSMCYVFSCPLSCDTAPLPSSQQAGPSSQQVSMVTCCCLLSPKHQATNVHPPPHWGTVSLPLVH